MCIDLRMAPLESYPFAPMQMHPTYHGHPSQQPYPVVGEAIGIAVNERRDIVVRDNRYRMCDTLLPNDVKERVAAGDVEWDGYRLRFF